MTERMLLEAIIEKHGIFSTLELIRQICDAKAAELVAYGDTAKAKRFARYAENLDKNKLSFGT
jgi:hypothetical protein